MSNCILFYGNPLPDLWIQIGEIVSRENPNCRLVKVESLKESLAIIHENDIDGILMQSGDGMDLCQSLKANPRTARIPILLLISSRNDREEWYRGLEMGIDEFLSLPIIPAELVAKIRILRRIQSTEAPCNKVKMHRDELVEEHTPFLHDSENPTRSLFAEMLEGYALHEIICDDRGRPVDYRFLEMNPAFEQLTGLSAETTLGKTVREVLPQTESYWIDTYGQVALTGTPIHFENYSSELDLYFRVVSYSPQKGQFVVLFQDITDLKHANRALRDSEQKYRLLSENIRDVIWTIDNDFHFTYVSPSIRYLRGIEPEEAMKESIADTMTAESFQVVQDAYAKTLEIESQGQINPLSRLEIRQKHKNGSLLWVEILIQPILNERSQRIGFIGVSRDITERKQAEILLQASEEKFSAIFQHAPFIATLIDIETEKYIDVNHQFLSMSGFEKKEVLGKTSLELGWITQEDHDRVLHLLQEQGYVRNLELDLHTKNGSCIRCQYDGELISINDHSFLLSMGADITMRKQYESERETTLLLLQLLNSESDKHTLIQTLTGFIQKWTDCESIGIRLREGDDFPYFETRGFDSEFIEFENRLCAYDSQGELIRDSQGNPVIECMCGNVLCGRFNPKLPFFTQQGSFWSNNTTQLLTSTTESDRQTRTRNRCNGEGYESVALIPLKHGETILGLLQLNSRTIGRFTPELIDYLERMANSIATALEQRITQEKLGESEKRYRQIVDTANEGILSIDENFQIDFVNTRMSEMLGYPAQDLIGKLIDSFLFESDLEDHRQKMAKRLKGMGEQYERRFRCRDGHAVWTIVSANSILDEHGHFRGSFAMVTDITERKQAEEEHRNLERQIQQAQKMEAIGTLAGGIAHDFNNILGSIIGFSELALYEKLPLDSEIPKCLEMILKASHRAKELVSQILTFSRKNEQEQHPIRVDTIVKEIAKMMRASLPSTIEIVPTFSADSYTILGNATQIHQVLVNLCTNAAHAMREQGGTLRITLQKKVLHSEKALTPEIMPPGSYLHLFVSDTGHGIDPSIQNRIFDPFFTTKSQNEGTGLGLSVVHGIVKSHRGSIQVESEPGKGTTFHILFPLLESIADHPETKSDIHYGKGERILYVDDEEVLLRLGERMLRQYGYQVTTQSQSKEALELFRNDSHRFDLVITDETMPKMKGSHLASELLKIRPDIPIILCTGYSDMLHTDKGKSLGLKDIVMKPVSWPEFSKIIATILKKHC